jgi:hypothetical protein
MFPPTFISDPNTDKNSITVAIIESPGPCRHCGGLGLISRGDAFQDARRRMLSQYDEYQRVLQPLSSTPFPPGIALEHLDQFEKTAQNFHETYGEPSEQSFVRTLLERTLKQIRASLGWFGGSSSTGARPKPIKRLAIWCAFISGSFCASHRRRLDGKRQASKEINPLPILYTILFSLFLLQKDKRSTYILDTCRIREIIGLFAQM